MSSPGKITTYMYTDWQLTANLYEYEVNSAEPKPEHMAWIKENVSKYRHRSMTAVIIGLASRTGTREKNIELSRHRAKRIASEFQRLDWSSLLVSQEVYVGEEVGKLLGLKDGIEDGRWRGVFFDLYNPEKVKTYGPVIRPAKQVERRIYVSIPISHKTTNRIPKTPEDRRGDTWARIGMDAAQYSGVVEPMPTKEKWDFIDDTWDLSEVKVEKREYKGDFVEMDYLDVSYTWRPAGGPRVLLNKGKKFPLTPDQATNWLMRPVRTFRRDWDVR